MNTKTIQQLRANMAQAGIQAYIVPSADAHGSEYLHPHSQARAFLSGFTGSAGTLAVLGGGQAALFTDGRYFLQAEEQLRGTGITLMREGQPGVPTLAGYLCGALQAGQAVGADARLLSCTAWQELECALHAAGIALRDAGDLVDALWAGRPALPDAPAVPLADIYTGQPVEEKLAWLREELRRQDADVYFASALDDIAWLYNLRGNDIPYNPVAFCFTAVEQGQALLFMEAGKPTQALRERLAQAGVELRPYAAVQAYVAGAHGSVLVDPARVNAALVQVLQARGEVRCAQDPVMLRKAMKNETELNAMREAHRRDGVALVRFWQYLRGAVGTGAVSEYTAGERLSALRREAGAVGDSFAPIVAYGPHAAIVHYSATAETDAPLQETGMLLVDSGGQYYGGTTDCTRVLALGPVSGEMRQHYTHVLQGMLRLSAARFPQGVYGDQLDVLARLSLWQAGRDYNHGTGHGIGSYLCVHEPPVVMNYRRRTAPPLAAGMVLSNEPGVYIPGSHGIRLENQLAVRQGEDGFLEFETLTLVPLDVSLLDTDLLQPSERKQLNAYHDMVYTTLAPLLLPAEQAFLQELTKAIE